MCCSCVLCTLCIWVGYAHLAFLLGVCPAYTTLKFAWKRDWLFNEERSGSQELGTWFYSVCAQRSCWGVCYMEKKAGRRYGAGILWNSVKLSQSHPVSWNTFRNGGLARSIAATHSMKMTAALSRLFVFVQCFDTSMFVFVCFDNRWRKVIHPWKWMLNFIFMACICITKANS